MSEKWPHGKHPLLAGIFHNHAQPSLGVNWLTHCIALKCNFLATISDISPPAGTYTDLAGMNLSWYNMFTGTVESVQIIAGL